MKNYSHAIYWLLLLFSVLFTRLYCNDGGPCPDVATVPVQTHPKVITPVIPGGVFKPEPKIIIHPTPQAIPVSQISHTQEERWDFATPTDSPPCDQLLDAYYSKQVYKEEYSDSAVTITTVDTVSENKIQSRVMSYLWKLPPVTIVRTHNGWYLGWTANAGIKGFTDTGPSLLFINKSDRAIAAHYDILNESFGASAYIPLEFNLFKKK